MHLCDRDAEIIALCAEIQRLNGIAADVREKRVEPFEDKFNDLLDGPGAWKERAAAAFSHSRETGRDDAIGDLEALFLKADKLFARMMTIPATTQAGRAAKVSTLLVHALGDGWRGPAKELDWEKEHTRALLGEFAGISADELAAI